MIENRNQLTRRTFLRGSVGAVAGAALLSPTIVPSSVFGANAPSNRVTVGMIGMGRQAYYSNVKSFLSFPDVQVVAVCDVDAWRLESGRKAVEDHYAKDRPSGNVQRLRGVPGLSRAAGPPGHRRGDGLHAGPLARADLDRGGESGQGRLL